MLTALAVFVVTQSAIGSAGAAPVTNQLSRAEIRQGWKLLFDGKTTNGWHNFKSKGVASGWTIQDGVLSCSDPSKAGDILTDEIFANFELKIDVNMTPHSNSGIMFHAEDEGGAVWHSGPEIQLYDNRADPKGQLMGWLYDLIPAKVDATKPAGEWNTVHIKIDKKECWTKMNGVEYYRFVLGSDDFKARVAKSKFANYVHFGNLGKGSVALQGDHGVVHFRNIKVRPLK